MLKFVIPAGKRVSSAMDDGKLKSIERSLDLLRALTGSAQICLEQICINLKGIRQDSLM